MSFGPPGLEGIVCWKSRTTRSLLSYESFMTRCIFFQRLSYLSRLGDLEAMLSIYHSKLSELFREATGIFTSRRDICCRSSENSFKNRAPRCTQKKSLINMGHWTTASGSSTASRSTHALPVYPKWASVSATSNNSANTSSSTRLSLSPTRSSCACTRAVRDDYPMSI